MADLMKKTIDLVYDNFKWIYIIVPLAIAFILTLIPNGKTHRWGIGILLALILLCFIYLLLMVIYALM